MAPCLDGREGIGYRYVGIVVSVDADYAVEAIADHINDFGEPGGEGAAVGVAEAEDAGSGFLCGFERAEGEVRVGDVAVEEMFGIVDDFLAVSDEVARRFPR